MSSCTPLICSFLVSEQCDLAGIPDDHEQWGPVVVGAGPGLAKAATAPTAAVGWICGDANHPNQTLGAC